MRYTYALLSFCTAVLGASAASASLPAPYSQIGVFRKGVWYLDDGDHVWNPARFDVKASFGQQGDQPVVGHTAGCFSSTNTFYPTATLEVMRFPATWYVTSNNLDWDPSDSANTFNFGTLDPNAKASNWNGVSVVYSNATFFVDWNGNHTWDSGDQSLPFGSAGDIPVIGIWKTGAGQRIGTFRNGSDGNGHWYIDYDGSNSWTAGDKTYSFGAGTDLPVLITYSDGVDHIAVFRNGTWFVDTNGNGAWNPGIDETWNFGQAGDIPVVARDGVWVSGPTPCP